jgi:peroxiredoxin
MKMQAGAPAPELTLTRITDGKAIHLSDICGHKPVVLIFGSLSCDRLCAQTDDLERLYRTYHDRAEFLFVYIREVHQRAEVPPSNRRNAVQQAIAAQKLTIPCALDSGKAEAAYNAWPKRLVVVGADGRIVLDAGRGLPDLWDLSEVEAWLKTQS